MSSDVIPLRTILFQLLFLLVAISLEAMVLRARLLLDRKTSVQSAATINLLSTFIGWMVFFIIEPWLPESIRIRLISYILFDLNVWTRQVAPLLIMIGFAIFFATFVIKVIGLDLLDALMERKPEKKAAVPQTPHYRARGGQQFSLQQVSPRPLAVLLANVTSFSAISVILLLRAFLEQSARQS